VKPDVPSASPPPPPLESAVLVFHTVAICIFAVIVLRFPASGLFWALGPLMCTRSAMTEPDASARARALAINLLEFGILQFLFSCAIPQTGLLILMLIPALLLVSMRRNGSCAGSVLLASLMNFQKGDFESAMNALLLMSGLAMSLPWGYLLAERLLRIDPDGALLPTPSPLTAERVLRRTFAFVFAAILEQFCTWEFRYWILYTVGMVYANGTTAEAARGVALIRLMAAPFAFLLSVVWLATIGYSDDRLNYLSVAWSFAAFYYSFGHRDYLGYYLLFSVMLSGVKDLVYGSSSQYGNGWALIFKSSAGVMLGAGLVLLCEHDFIGKKAVLSPQK